MPLFLNVQILFNTHAWSVRRSASCRGVANGAVSALRGVSRDRREKPLVCAFLCVRLVAAPAAPVHRDRAQKDQEKRSRGLLNEQAEYVFHKRIARLVYSAVQRIVDGRAVEAARQFLDGM